LGFRALGMPFVGDGGGPKTIKKKTKKEMDLQGNRRRMHEYTKGKEGFGQGG